MTLSMKEPRERFFSSFPPLLLRCVDRLLESAPFTFACVCVLLIPFALALIFSAVYISTFLYGVVSSHPFASRDFFLCFPALGTVFASPAALAKALFFYAITGAILSFFLQRVQQPAFGLHLLNLLDRHWNTVSFLIIFSLIFATLGEVYFSYTSRTGTLAGIIPYTDANGHYSFYTKYFYDGVMGNWTLRRPIAAFMGATILWLAGNDPASALLLRCFLVCFGMWASCAVMNKSYGVWSAVACLALEYAYIWTYLHTFWTETLGFFWGCMAAALWLHALREKRLFWDLAAFSVTLAGLLTRMGAMFLVPTLFFYVLWRWYSVRHVRGWWKKPLLGLCICAAVIFVLNTVFASRGVGDHQQTGSNFSYSFAGLTLGTNWAGAQTHYAQKLRTLKNEKQTSRFLYKEGLKNILHSPGIFLKRLAEGEAAFLKNSNFFLFHNWYLVALVAGLLAFRRKTLFSRSSTGFWVAAWTGILVSIPFIYFDDSWRVNIFVYPLIGCFFSLALTRRQPDDGSVAAVRRCPAAPLLAVVLSSALLMLMTSVALFPGLHTAEGIHRIQKYAATVPKRPANMVLVGANGMGALVVPDDEVPTIAVPVMTWSTFQDRYRQFSRSVDEVLFAEGFPKPPFVILNQIPVIGSPGAYGYFLAPPEVLTQKDVLLWDFETSGAVKDAATGIPWKIVTKARPVLYK